MAEPQVFLGIPEGLDAARINALARCLAAVAGSKILLPAPVIAPAMLLGHPKLADLAAEMAPPAGLGMVHESQSFERRAKAKLDSPLRVGANLTAKGAGRLFDFTLYGANGTELGKMQTRLRLVSPEDMTRLKGSRFPPHLDTGDVFWRQSREFGASGVSQYLALAQDPNPIHVSDKAAKEVGLEGAVVPGMFFAGVAEVVLAGVLPECVIKTMKLRFMAPVLVGQGVRFGVLTRSHDKHGVPTAVRIFVLRLDDMIVAIADLEVALDYPEA